MVTRLSSPSSSFLTCKNTELSYIFIKQKLHVMPDTKWSPLATWDCSKALASRKMSPCTSSWATQAFDYFEVFWYIMKEGWMGCIKTLCCWDVRYKKNKIIGVLTLRTLQVTRSHG